MKKLNRKIIFIVFIIIACFFMNKCIVDDRLDILLNYNETNYEHTQFIVDIEGKQSASWYYLIDEDYYKYNKNMSKEWIEEDIEIKNLGNEYCKPRIEILKSIQNLEKTKNAPNNSTPDMSMDFLIQQDKIFDKNSWNYYDGRVSIYLEDNIISIDKFGFKGDSENLFKKPQYYIINENIKENVNKILEQVIN